MRSSKSGKVIIETRKGRVMTLEELFKSKERFHKESAKLPFEEKIKKLTEMRKIVEAVERAKIRAT